MDDIRYISRLDSEYPEKLRNIPGAPAGLYVRGSLPDPLLPSVAIVGSRNCSEYGRKIAAIFSKRLAEKRIQIISGMARGIDGIAQAAAVDAGGCTFGVLGCGVDVIYPKENSALFGCVLEKGGLISEVAPGSAALKSQFPSRNRIISGLADILLVVEARIKSGTGITVRYALDQGRDIFAIPGRLTDPLSAGCNRLIADGAGIALLPDDIIRALGIMKPGMFIENSGACNSPDIEAAQKLTLAGSEKVVYSLLDLYPKTLDEIVCAGKLKIPDAMEALLGLMIKGYAAECGKNNYIRKI